MRLKIGKILAVLNPKMEKSSYIKTPECHTKMNIGLAKIIRKAIKFVLNNYVGNSVQFSAISR